MDDALLDAPATTVLMVTGPDRPGAASKLFGALGALDAPVLDVEQVVVRGRLILGVLIGTALGADAISSVEEALAPSGFSLTVESTQGDAQQRPAERATITLLGLPLTAQALTSTMASIAELGGNVDRIHRIARYPVTAIELEVSGAPLPELRRGLVSAASQDKVDIAVQPAGLHRRAKRLIVMDVDSTLIQGEVVEMLASHAGCEDEVKRITDRAMAGELDFAGSLIERVALLEGLPVSVLDEVRASIKFMPGARTLMRTLHRLGYQTAIVSGGFTQITDPLARELNITHARANTLEIINGRLTGRVVGPVIDRAAKAQALRSFAEAEGIPLSQTVAVGDGANDIDMIEAAGLGVAFNAKPILKQAADTSVSFPYLDALLYLLGITRDEVEAADAEVGIDTPAPPLL